MPELVTFDAPHDSRPGFSRRRFLQTVSAGLAGLALPRALEASTAPAARSLALLHTHTGERLALDYFRDGRYLPESLGKVNHFLRDFRTGEVHAIDPDLLDLVHELAGAAGCHQPFHVISGFRSPATNAALRQRSEGVAVSSLHMKGQAIDIRPVDVPLAQLHASALALRAGGVGYYPASNFIHVDVGRVRRW